jgi:hypothetical protein
MVTQEPLPKPDWKLAPLRTLEMAGTGPDGVILARNPAREAPLNEGKTSAGREAAISELVRIVGSAARAHMFKRSASSRAALRATAPRKS